ncbi:MAG: cation:proton antiporter [Patescibacteria group bacterium]
MQFLSSTFSFVLESLSAVDPLLVELGVILVLAAIIGIILKALKQPLILAYLIAGLIIGFLGFFNIADTEALSLFSDLGVMFLLFLVGLEMDYQAIKKVGKTSLLLGAAQMIISAAGGFLISYFLFSFSLIASIYIAVALSFSSTVIIVKLLSEKGDLNSLYGRVSVGLLLVQDMVVILILIALNAIEGSGGIAINSIFQIIAGGILMFGLMMALGRSVFPYIFRKIAHSQELLFLVSLAWLLFFSIVAKAAGFSIEIAGFLAGIALANSSHKYHIASKVKPLRDFFILIFFATIGSLMAVSNFGNILIPIIVLTFFVMVTKPIIVMFILKYLGYTKRTNFLTSATIPQISEFSLIFASVGLSMGHINDQVFAIIATVGMATFTLSTYSILYADKMYPFFSNKLDFFEKNKTIEEEESDYDSSKPIILIGAHRTGEGIMNYIDPDDLLVIDFDPIVIDELKKRGIKHLFSDITDPHVFEHLNLYQAEVVISTSPNLKDNLDLIRRLKKHDKNIKIIVRSETKREALQLYDEGVDYVLLPHFVSGQYLGSIIDPEFDLSRLKELKEIDLKLLTENN